MDTYVVNEEIKSLSNDLEEVGDSLWLTKTKKWIKRFRK